MNPVVSYIKQTLQGYYPDSELVPMAKLLLTQVFGMSVVELYAKKRGLVLVTGPTGSGKSTTLASLIDKINDERNAHVITLEDPIEYLHSHRKAMINQREIGLDTHSYADALRAPGNRGRVPLL